MDSAARHYHTLTLANREGPSRMESDLRYYTRRISMEHRAAACAVTAKARDRRLQLVERYRAKVAELVG